MGTGSKRLRPNYRTLPLPTDCTTTKLVIYFPEYFNPLYHVQLSKNKQTKKQGTVKRQKTQFEETDQALEP